MVDSMQTLKYIKKVRYSNIDYWSVQYLIDSSSSYNEKFRLAKIGDFLKKNRTIIKIEDLVEYNRVTVKIKNRGVELRDIEKGENIGTKKQYLVKSGQFIVSKIDARNGSFGIVPDYLDKAIVTNDFPLFDIDKSKINPDFLLFITTTNEFIKFAQSCSSGTTNRQRMDIDKFLDQNIPLPTLVEQNRIIDAYNSKLNLSKQQENEAKQLVGEIEEYLFNELGKEKEVFHKRSKGLKFINYNEIDKWGLDFIGNNNNNKNKYKTLKIKDFCKISSGGTPSRGIKEYFKNGTIPWVKTGELTNEILYITEENITEEALKNSSAKLYDAGSIVIAMYGATIGKTAKLGIPASTNQACAVLFNIDNSKILTDYLWEYLQLQTENLKKLAYGSAQPNLNAGIISNYKIPIPPVEKQKEIFEKIYSIKTKIKQLNSLSINNKEEAISVFEKEIFN
jgi:restriction endonuclease S subunit